MKATKVRKLTNKQKVEITLLKEFRPTATSTNKNIARSFDVSTDLVNRINFDALTPEQKELYHLQKNDLKYHALDLTYHSVKKARQLVELATKPSELPAIMGAAKIGNDIYRLETDQPTSITAQQNIEPIALAIQSAWNKYKLFCEQNNIEYPSESDLIERINRVANERNVDAKMLADRVLKAD